MEKDKPKKAMQSVLDWCCSVFLMFTYDLLMWFFDSVIHTFFRELTQRGTHHIPRKGAAIFVIAPHHNQFVDPLVVMTSVRKVAGRRISLLTAAASLRLWYIGIPAKLSGAIPVERAQDLVAPAPGTIWIENFARDNDNLTVLGEGTQFTKDAMAKGLVGLPNYLGNATIDKVVSDTKLVLKQPFKINFDSPLEKDKRMMALLSEGTSYKLAPHIDNHRLFQNVFDHLNAGKVFGIFPEGGLHDRPTLLPLKPGVAIMALGAVSQSTDPNQQVNIIPVGLNYFHPHKFRSRVVVEFGKPIVVTKKDGEEYEQNTREVVGRLLDLITLRLREVTFNCPDFDTLMAIHAARRFYTSQRRKDIPLPMVVEMSRRLLRGYQKYADQPDVQQLKEAVGEYNKKLMILGLHDHQVESLTRTNRLSILKIFLTRLIVTTLFFVLAMPGTIMFSPVFIVARRISHKKQREALASSTVKIKAKDVIGTWKILVALVLAPALYIFWAAVAVVVLRHLGMPRQLPLWLVFTGCYLVCVLTTYASLRVGEVGMDSYKSLTPLFYSVLLAHRDILQIENLKQTRRELAAQVMAFCDRYGPLVFDDFGELYNEYGGKRKERAESGLAPISPRNLSDVQLFSNVSDDKSDESQEESNDASEPASDATEPTSAASEPKSSSDESKSDADKPGSHMRRRRQ